MKIDGTECGVCELCIEICPLELIKKKGFKIVIEEGCDNCGECVEICPTGCITLDESPDE